MAVVNSLNANTTIYLFDELWVNRLGVPDYLSADHEFFRRTITNLLEQRGIKFKTRPA